MKFAILFTIGTFIVGLAALTITVIAKDGLDILNFFSLLVVGLLCVGFFTALVSSDSPSDDL